MIGGMTQSPGPEPGLVPELLVTDISASLEFWCAGCGFAIRYHRLDEGFAYITRGSAHVMLEQVGIGRNWIAGPLDRPYGRGINLQVSVPDIEPILAGLAGRELFLEPEVKWYRVGDEEAGVRQFVVQDPDGYLIRFSASIGRRRPG